MPRAEPSWPHFLRIGLGSIGVVTGMVVAREVSLRAADQPAPVLDHLVRLLLFVPVIEGMSRVLYGAERIAGFRTAPIILNAYRSRTVAEFWRRYNYRLYDWLFGNVFRWLGGRRAPARSVIGVFVFSGFFHEAAFALATSRVTGYQFAFFAIQGPAVLVSRPLDRWVRRGGLVRRVTAHSMTILFMSVTSVLFFHGVSEVFPWVLPNGSPLP